MQSIISNSQINIEIIDRIKELVKEYPNNTDLGEKVRRVINNILKEEQNVRK